MMLLRRVLPWLLIMLTAWPAAAALPSRPFAGIGLLVLRPLSPSRVVDDGWLAIYEEPGVRRITVVHTSDLPRLAYVLKSYAGEIPVSVKDKRGSWLKISYDDAGRSGWINFERSWTYLSWNDFLKSHEIKLLPGLRKSFHILREQKGDSSPGAALPNGVKAALRIMEVDGDWCRVAGAKGLSGWLRWRDGDGRFLVSVDGIAER